MKIKFNEKKTESILVIGDNIEYVRFISKVETKTNLIDFVLTFGNCFFKENGDVFCDIVDDTIPRELMTKIKED